MTDLTTEAPMIWKPRALEMIADHLRYLINPSMRRKGRLWPPMRFV